MKAAGVPEMVQAALLWVVLLAGAAPPPFKPTPACQKLIDAHCQHNCWPQVHLRSAKCDAPMVGRKSGPTGLDTPQPEWRCYSPSSLSKDGLEYVNGSCYCGGGVRFAIRTILKSCGDPDPEPGAPLRPRHPSTRRPLRTWWPSPAGRAGTTRSGYPRWCARGRAWRCWSRRSSASTARGPTLTSA